MYSGIIGGGFPGGSCVPMGGWLGYKRLYYPYYVPFCYYPQPTYYAPFYYPQMMPYYQQLYSPPPVYYQAW